MNDIKAELSKQFYDFFGNNQNLRFFSAPGRVNLIGEHIDYCGGLVMPVALSKVCTVAVRENGTDTVRLAATDMPGKIFSFSLKNIAEAGSLSWGNYQAGIFEQFANKGCILSGLDMLFSCNVPFGSGLSSSASIELSCAVAINSIFHAGFDLVTLALMSQKAENTFCGVNCGIMDQFASAMGKKDCAIKLDCASLSYEYIPLKLGNYVIVLANTKAKHALGTSKYNERRREADEALSVFQKALFKNQLCDYTPADYEKYCHLIENETVRNRAKHIIFENQRVKDSGLILKSGDMKAFGEIMHKGNESIRYLYEATGAELDAMYDAAVKMPCCIGSRMTGGGFGGCTVNIVEADKTDLFIETVGKEYSEKTGLVPEFYISESGDGAREI